MWGDTATLRLEQTTPPTPGQPVKQPVPIPLKLALFDPASGKHHGEQLVVLTEASGLLGSKISSRGAGTR